MDITQHYTTVVHFATLMLTHNFELRFVYVYIEGTITQVPTSDSRNFVFNLTHRFVLYSATFMFFVSFCSVMMVCRNYEVSDPISDFRNTAFPGKTNGQ